MLAAWEWLKHYWQFVIIGLLTVSVGLVLFLLLRTPAPTQKSDDVFTSSHSAVLATASTASTTAPTTTQTGFVDVKEQSRNREFIKLMIIHVCLMWCAWLEG